MRALIHQPRHGARTSLLDVAGRPLIARQLQWLRAMGCNIAVEIDPHPEAQVLAEWLEQDALGQDVELALTPRAAGPRTAAHRLGWGGRFMAVPADALCNFDPFDLFRAGRGAQVGHIPRAMAEATRARIELVDLDAPGDAEHCMLPGSGLVIAGEASAFAATKLVLEGRLRGPWSVPVHADERRPGVFVARGAVVAEDAQLIAPVYVGAGAFVAEGARVGPAVVIGDRAVVPPFSLLRDTQVEPDTFATAAIVAEQAVVSASGVRNIGGHTEPTPLPAPPISRAARILALALLVVAWPFRAWRRRLWSVTRGQLHLIGLAEHDAVPGVLTIDEALVPTDATDEERGRARAWYAASKSRRLDLYLGASLMLRRMRAA